MNVNGSTLEIVEVTDPVVLQDIYKLRVEVWTLAGIPHSNFPSGIWKDDHDDHAMHWAVIENGYPLAAARLCVHQSISEVPQAEIFEGLQFDFVAPIASITRQVIHPKLRGIGISRQFDYVRLLRAKALGCKTLVAWWAEVTGEMRLNKLKGYGFKVISPLNFRSVLPLGNATALMLSLSDLHLFE